MGLIRKAAYLGSGGIVAPRSRKGRQHAQVIAAMQGKSAEEIRRAGGRYDFEGFWTADGVTEAREPTAPGTTLTPYDPKCPECGKPRILSRVADGSFFVRKHRLPSGELCALSPTSYWKPRYYTPPPESHES